MDSLLYYAINGKLVKLGLGRPPQENQGSWLFERGPNVDMIAQYVWLILIKNDLVAYPWSLDGSWLNDYDESVPKEISR